MSTTARDPFGKSMTLHLPRREFSALLLGSLASTYFANAGRGNSRETGDSDQRIRGLLLGGLVGDALGGPLEFSDSPPEMKRLANVRAWEDDRRLTQSDRENLARSLPLHDYKTLRPSTAPYGPWTTNAPLGTLTDDSRHKIVLMQAIRSCLADNNPLTPSTIARAFLDFAPRLSEVPSQSETTGALRALDEEGFREYRYAARWLLGERDLEVARPPERLWAGVNNCSGQMMFPPLAAAFVGKPEQAYLATYWLDFIDTPMARDIIAAFNAGLANVLALPRGTTPKKCWDQFHSTLRSTDPYKQNAIPFAGRPLDRWLDRVDDWLEKSDGRPKKLFELLETEGKPEFWWDAHFTLVVPLSIFRLCEFDPLAAMHLTLDFGHDTDSYAQILGCLVGAMYTETIFPNQISEAVTESLESDYGENYALWPAELQSVQINPTELAAP